MTNVDKQRDPHDRALIALFSQSDPQDLSLLVDYLTGHGKGREAHARADAFAVLTQARMTGQYGEQVFDTMLLELKRFGDNSILRLFRQGGGPSYLEIVRDVARHFNARVTDADAAEVLEARILESLMEQAWHKMTDAERAEFLAGMGTAAAAAGPAALAGALAALQLGGFAAYRIALLVANSLARAIAGRSLSMATNTTLDRTVRMLAGPVGWAVAAIWTAFDLASPSYRVTVPCVVQIAYMRQKQSLNICPACDAPNDKAARFCNQCGAAMARAASEPMAQG